jgi:hypothetical protein
VKAAVPSSLSDDLNPLTPQSLDRDSFLKNESRADPPPPEPSLLTQEHPMSKHNVSTKDGAMSAQGDKSRRAALCALTGASAQAIPPINSVVAAVPDQALSAIQRDEAAL